MKSSRKKKRGLIDFIQGFTLVELLVVIVILGIIIGISIPLITNFSKW